MTGLLHDETIEEAVSTPTRPIQDQASQKPSMGGGRGYKVQISYHSKKGLIIELYAPFLN